MVELSKKQERVLKILNYVAKMLCLVFTGVVQMYFMFFGMVHLFLGHSIVFYSAIASCFVCILFQNYMATSIDKSQKSQKVLMR